MRSQPKGSPMSALGQFRPNAAIAFHMYHELAGSDLAEIGEGITLVGGSVLAIYKRAASHESALHLGKTYKLSHCPWNAVRREFCNSLHTRQTVPAAASGASAN